MTDRPCIVAIGAHAADMEFSAGATLIRHVRAGWDAHLVHLTLGEKGHATLCVGEYGAQKREEALAAAEVIGAQAHFLDCKDGELDADEETAREIARILRVLRPSVIITHWSRSIHRDHEAAHELTRRAVFLAAIRHFDLDGLPATRCPRAYYADNWEDTEGFRPYVYVDVSAEMDAWAEVFRCFAIGRGEGRYPYWDWYQARTRLHGIGLRVAHAQAFAIDEKDIFVTRETL
ncbi:MAG: PIG-L family deacetylase [Armatimonadetes bacterium]|nr:PIG-L family deacetylase [Armatimonadota bacterium]